MTVLNFYSERHKPVTVDVFVTEPFDFDHEYEQAMQGELAAGLTVRFVSIPTLSRKAVTRPEPGWETATWEGARRAQLQAALALSVRERLKALDGMWRLSQHLSSMPRPQRRAAPAHGR